MLKSIATFAWNVLWLLSCMPGWIRFQFALRHPRRAQENILRRLLRQNRDAAFGRRHGFADIRTPEEFAARVPMAEYEDYAASISAARKGAPFPLAAETPGLLEPTSGSSGAPKLIPLTPALQREFSAAIQPWIAWLYLAHPRLLFGRQYWAVSPNTPPPQREDASPDSIPAGFSDDAEYLGPAGRFLSRGLLATPPELRHVADREAFFLLTLFFLLRDENLRLISIWHPSFLTLLLDAIPRHLPALLLMLRSGVLPASELDPELHRRLSSRISSDPRRADELESLDLPAHPERIACAWPHLEVISCWAGDRSEPWLDNLRARFPRATLQGKGLLATEGVVTLPTGCGKLRPCALRSHYLEFIDPETAAALPVWQLQSGREYSVALTTGGGLWRYRLHDRVRVTGFCHATPCLEFLGKDNLVSDLVGEKLDEHHVAAALSSAQAAENVHPAFAMLVPDAAAPADTPGYHLWLDLPGPGSPSDCSRRLAEAVENELLKNFHYAHARNLGQLAPLRPRLVPDAARLYRAWREQAGSRIGTIKFPALATSALPFGIPGRTPAANP